MKAISVVRTVAGLLATVAGLIEGGVLVGAVDAQDPHTVKLIAAWIGIAAGICGIIYRGDWLHGPEEAKPAPAPPAG